MELFLGVDGGQTSTRAVLGDEAGSILARITAGPSNHTEEPGGEARLEAVVRVCLEKVLAAVHLAKPAHLEFATACFGMTGETEIKRRVLERIIQARSLLVVHDSVNALAGATEGKPGIIVIAGTGSVARGVNAAGAEMRAGGWGHLFADEGSAYWIGREAVRAVTAQFDGFGDATALTSALFERLDEDSPYNLMAKCYSGEWSHDRLAGLAVCVNDVAQKGDRVAGTILKNAGSHLARLALTIIAHIFPSTRAAGSENLVVSYSGGVFESQIVFSSFQDSIHCECPHAAVLAPRLPPVLGSLILAYRSAGIAVSAASRQRWLEAQQDDAPKL